MGLLGNLYNCERFQCASLVFCYLKSLWYFGFPVMTFGNVLYITKRFAFSIFFNSMQFPSFNNFSVQIPNHVALKIALELKKLLIDNSLLDVYVMYSAISNFLFPSFVTFIT